MALSLLAQHPSLLDLQTFFDPFPLQQQQQQQFHNQNQIKQQQQRNVQKIVTTNCINNNSNNNNNNHNNNNNNNQMEYNTQIHYQQNNNSNTNNNNINNNGNNNNNSVNSVINKNNNNNNSSSNNNIIQQTNSGNNNQNLNTTNRTFMSGYHHQHIGTDYEQVINFVDSPPNSEESWTDEQSKGSPGPQIIDVQTIYTHSGARKRRMDWDSLDIGHSENAAATQSAEIPNKIQYHEKDKHKKEKQTGRGSWADDIGFDLNAEFNSNSYLNNESFLFSPALNALKQEPQNEHLKTNKSPLHTQATAGGVVPKTDKSSSAATADERKNSGLNENNCVCGSPQNSKQDFDHNVNGEKSTKVITEHGNSNGNAGVCNKSKIGIDTGAVIQQLSVVDASKIENSLSAVGATAAAPHNEDHKFQYILAAATSIATKNNEETLTYLNQGQSYEIKLKKIGDLSFYRDKILKSVIKICFHERRLQFMEREQMQQWQASRPGERIIEVDVPLSYGLCHISQPLNPNYLNAVEVFWDPLKEVGVYIKVNCISTEFTPKKHGGEKGVPFRLQIETYIENTNHAAAAATNTLTQTAAAAVTVSPDTPGNLSPTNSTPIISGKQPVHGAACQIKVFKLKGADRKHKQDREKIQKRPISEQEKFQPSYECTIMNDISLDLITPIAGCYSPEYMKIWPNSPVHIPKYDGVLPFANASPNANNSPIAINSVTSSNSPTLKLMDTNMISPQHLTADMDDFQTVNIMPESTPPQVSQWLTSHRLTAYLATFAHFSGSDIMRMSKDDLIQICGLADGIRMFNILRAKAITPRLTVYVSLDGSSYNAIYLISNTAKELTQKLYKLPGFYEVMAKNANNGALENGGLYNGWSMHSKYSGSGSNIFNDVNKSFVYISGPSGVHVTVTDEVLNNEIKDGSLYALDVQNGKVVLKLLNKNDN